MIKFENYTGADGLIDVNALYNSIKQKRCVVDIFRAYTTYNNYEDWRDCGTYHSEIFEHIETDDKNEILRRVAELNKTADEYSDEFYYALDCTTNQHIR